MRDNHTFIRVKGETSYEILTKMVDVALENPYGMVCPPVILKNDKEYKRYSTSANVNIEGSVNLSEWIKDVELALEEIDKLNANYDEVKDRATHYFKEEMEGEPLTDSSVIEGLTEFSKIENKRYYTEDEVLDLLISCKNLFGKYEFYDDVVISWFNGNKK